MKKRVVVTGGNGFVGRATIEHLKNAGAEILSFQRSKINKSEVELVFFDLANIHNSKFEKLAGVDVVIHTAALVHKKKSSEKDQFKLNYEASRVLFDKCISNGVKKFIFLSTIGVHGRDSGPEKLKITTPLAPKSFYAMAKLKSERYFLSRKTKTEVFVLRLPLIYGIGAPGNFGMLEKIAASNVPLPFLGVKNRRSLIGVNYLAEILKTLSFENKVPKGVHIVAEKNPFSIEDLIKNIRAQKGSSQNLFLFPSWIIKFFLVIIGRRKIYEQLFQDLEIVSTIEM